MTEPAASDAPSPEQPAAQATPGDERAATPLGASGPAPEPAPEPAPQPTPGAAPSIEKEERSARAGWTEPTTLTVSRPLALSVGAAALAAVALSGWLWLRLNEVQSALARQSADTGVAAMEARALARSAQEIARETAGRQAVMESRLSEVALQRSQLEELMQSLSRSRDENLMVDIESALRLALQQSQLTGSVEPLLAALRAAEQRVGRAAQPRLNRVQRAIATDIERIRAATVTDVPALLVRLDELARMIDDLPMANRVGPPQPAPATPSPPPAAASASMSAPRQGRAGAAQAPAPAPSAPTPLDAAWWRALGEHLRDEARRLVRVGRVDEPEAALIAPDQTYFLRENLKLKLLNARLGVLARQFDASRADLIWAQGAINRYFDVSARRTQNAQALLAQVQQQMKTVSVPRIDETLTALSAAAAGR